MYGDENAFVAQAVADSDASDSEDMPPPIQNGHHSREAASQPAPSPAAAAAPVPAAAAKAPAPSPLEDPMAYYKKSMAAAAAQNSEPERAPEPAAAAAAPPEKEEEDPEPAPEPEPAPAPEPEPDPEPQKTTRSGRAVKARDVFNAEPAPPPSRIRQHMLANPGTLPSEVCLPPEERRRKSGMLKCEREGLAHSAGDWRVPTGARFRRDGPDSVWVQVRMAV